MEHESCRVFVYDILICYIIIVFIYLYVYNNWLYLFNSICRCCVPAVVENVQIFEILFDSIGVAYLQRKQLVHGIGSTLTNNQRVRLLTFIRHLDMQPRQGVRFLTMPIICQPSTAVELMYLEQLF